jgi:protein phosphatase PTC1
MDPQAASKALVEHALNRFSTDNLSCMVVRFNNQGMKSHKADASIGVEGDEDTPKGAMSEADHIVEEATKKLHGHDTKTEQLDQDTSTTASTDAPGLKSDLKLNPEAVKAAVKNSS